MVLMLISATTVTRMDDVDLVDEMRSIDAIAKLDVNKLRHSPEGN